MDDVQTSDSGDMEEIAFSVPAVDPIVVVLVLELGLVLFVVVAAVLLILLHVFVASSGGWTGPDGTAAVDNSLTATVMYSPMTIVCRRRP